MRRHLGGGIWSALQGFWFRILGDFSLSIRVQVGWPLACVFFNAAAAHAAGRRQRSHPATTSRHRLLHESGKAPAHGPIT